MGRLRPGATAAAGAERSSTRSMRQLAPALSGDERDDAGGGAAVLAVAARAAADAGDALLAILQGIMLLLLLAVCGNTANLMLARASARQREMGVRAGARRRPLARRRACCSPRTCCWRCSARRSAPRSPSGARDALRAVPLLGALPDPLPDRRRRGRPGRSPCCWASACGLIFGWRPALQLARLDPQLALRAGARTRGAQPAAQRADGDQVGAGAGRAGRRRRCSSAASARRATPTPASGATACCSPPTT